MSASIYWEPVPRRARTLDVGGKTFFIDALQNAGLGAINDGDGIILNEVNLPVLRGMAAVFDTGADRTNPYQQLIDAIEKHGSIRLWAVY